MSIEDMFAEKRLHDIFILARYFYRIGEPIMNDRVYEQYLSFVKKNPGKCAEYLDRTYDDDPIPVDLLKEIGVEPVKEIGQEQLHTKEHTDLVQYLNEEKSLSIKSVTNYDEAFSFFSFYREMKKDLMISLKMDGINTKSLYLDGIRKLTLSRGRTGNSFDFTNTVGNALPKNTTKFPKEAKIFAECFVDYDYLPTLRKKYNSDGYKMAKSAAISLLRVQHNPEDYKHLHAVVIASEGLEFNTLQENFDFLESQGFEIPVHKLIKWNEIPQSLDQFKSWAKINIFDYMYELTRDIPSDGIVVEVNDLNFQGFVSGMYTNRQLALKFEQWNFQYYEGIVKNIIWEQQRVYASCRIEIEPIQTKDAEARIINAFNMGLLIEEGINIGSKIYFERNSDAYNVLIYGERLKKIRRQLGEE